MDSLSSSGLVCSYFLFPGSVLGDWTFLWICPFLQGCSFYWHMVHSNLLQYFSVSGNFFFIPDFIDLHPLPPHPAFGYESGSRFINFCLIFSKNQLLVSFIFSSFFFFFFGVPISFVSALILIISFLLQILGFACCFPSFSDVRLGLSEIFYFLR